MYKNIIKMSAFLSLLATSAIFSMCNEQEGSLTEKNRERLKILQNHICEKENLDDKILQIEKNNTQQKMTVQDGLIKQSKL